MKKKFQILDVTHPFFKPLWARVLTVAIPGLWAVVEFLMGSPGFGMLFAGAAFYAGFELFFMYEERIAEAEAKAEAERARWAAEQDNDD